MKKKQKRFKEKRPKVTSVPKADKSSKSVWSNLQQAFNQKRFETLTIMCGLSEEEAHLYMRRKDTNYYDERYNSESKTTSRTPRRNGQNRSTNKRSRSK